MKGDSILWYLHNLIVITRVVPYRRRAGSAAAYLHRGDAAPCPKLAPEAIGFGALL